MSKPQLNPSPSPVPAPESFALDSHTRQFFDPNEWGAPAEARFYLDMPGVRGREFLGRIVVFCEGNPLIAM